MIETGIWQLIKEKVRNWWHAEDEIDINQVSQISDSLVKLHAANFEALTNRRDVILKYRALTWEDKLKYIQEIAKQQLEMIKEFQAFLDHQLELFKVDTKKKLEATP